MLYSRAGELEYTSRKETIMEHLERALSHNIPHDSNSCNKIDVHRSTLGWWSQVATGVTLIVARRKSEVIEREYDTIQKEIAAIQEKGRESDLGEERRKHWESSGHLKRECGLDTQEGLSSSEVTEFSGSAGSPRGSARI